MKRVRAGGIYFFSPVILDIVLREHCDAKVGQRVRVVNLPGAPKCNTMGHCHIEDADTNAFLGICSVFSLVKR